MGGGEGDGVKMMMILKVVKELGGWHASSTLRSRVAGLLEVSAVLLAIRDTC